MACGGCKNGKGNRYASGNGGDLSRYAFLSPAQLRLQAAKKAAAEAASPEPSSEGGE